MRINSIFALIVLSILSFEIKAQNQADTVIANSNFNTGDSLLRLAQHREAITYYDKAGDIYKQLGVWDRYVDCLNKSAEGEWRSSQFDRSLEKSRLALKECAVYLGDNSEQGADAYSNIGVYFGLQAKHDSALIYFEKSLEIQKVLFGDKHLKVAKSLSRLGLTAGNSGKFEQALDYLHQCRLIQEELDPESLELALTYRNLAYYLKIINRFTQAEEYSRKSLEINEKLLPPDHPAIAQSLSGLAGVFFDFREYDLALKTSLRALRIFEKTIGESHFLTLSTLNQVAISYQNINDFEQAFLYYDRYERAILNVYSEAHPDYLNILYGKGLLFFELFEYDSAASYFNKAYQFYQKYPAPKSIGLPSVLHALGSVESEKRNFLEGIKKQKEAIELAEQANRYTSVVLYANEVSDDYRDIGELDSALYFLDLAERTNLRNPSGSKIPFDYILLLRTKWKKAVVLYRKFHRDGNLDFAMASYKNHLLSDSLIQIIRYRRNTYEDKVEFSANIKRIYQGSVD
ncbi:MAG: tetratricopeptide repeat protein, partial [Bacteroidota bacterium]